MKRPRLIVAGILASSIVVAGLGSPLSRPDLPFTNLASAASATPLTSERQCVSPNFGGVTVNFDDLPNATVVQDQYASLGLHVLATDTTRGIIYGDTSERTTSSNPNSLANDAVSPSTSSNVPLTLGFKVPQSAVGFYFGNGDPRNPPRAVLTAYDGSGTLLGQVETSVTDNNLTQFFGIAVDGGISSVTLDYGATTGSEEIDNLCFAAGTPAQHRVAYIYNTNLAARDSFESLLTLHGFTVDLVPITTTATFDFSAVRAIIVGDDTGYLGTWGNADAVSQVQKAGKPVIGVGEGGYALFGQLGLAIGWPNGAHGTAANFYAVDPTQSIYTTPNPISIGASQVITHYTTGVNTVEIHVPEAPPSGVRLIGRLSGRSPYYTLLTQNNCYLLWGNSGSPATMTAEGQHLFINAVHFPTCGATHGPTATPTATGTAGSPTSTATATLTPTRTPTRTPTATPIPLADISVTGLEMTQGIQNISNNMPLVKGRQTRARAYVQTNLRDLSGVRARIRAFRGGVELTGSPRNANNIITARTTGGTRTNLNDGFWFYIPPDWRSGTVTFRVEVNYNGSVPESNAANNQLSRTVSFQQSNELNLVMVPLHLHNNGNRDNPARTYYATNPSFTRLLYNVLRFHPISEINWWYYESPEYPSFHGWPFYNEWDVSTKGGRSAILGAVEWKNFWTWDWVSNLHWMGMVHPDLNTDGGLGIGNRPGKNSWTKMVNSNDGWPSWYLTGGNSMAHELGHNKGLKHMPCSGNESSGGETDSSYPYPFPNCSLAGVSTTGYYGFDVYYQTWGLSGPTVLSNDPGVSSPNRAFPLLGYQRPRWISPYEYCKLLPQYGIPCGLTAFQTQGVELNAEELQAEQLEAAMLADPTAFAEPAQLNALATATQFIAAGGIISTTAGTADFNGVYQVDNPAPDAVETSAQKLGYLRVFGAKATAPFLLVQVDPSGGALDSREIYLGNDDELGTDVHQFLELIPLAQGTTRIQIRQGENVLAERFASANPPSVRLLTPNGGETMAVGSKVTWEASDPDGDELRYTLQYSADDGRTWRALAVDVLTPTVEIDNLRELPGSSTGRIRVVANDGFHTAQDDSDGPFTTPGSGPLALILQPEAGAQVETSQTVVLGGIATDVEDGPLKGASLGWTSSLQGALGAGEELPVDNLAEGTHQLTLTATDSSGLTGSAAVTITVSAPVNEVLLPLVARLTTGAGW